MIALYDNGRFPAGRRDVNCRILEADQTYRNAHQPYRSPIGTRKLTMEKLMADSKLY